MASFEHVVDEYEAGRPGYPAGVYDALGSIEGLDVLEGGAGTGLATRELVGRGAHVFPFDLGPAMLDRAVQRSPGLAAVVADGGQLPFRDQCVDLVCFAQSWHWLPEDRRCAEVARVLRPTGRWAGWWSHARADGSPWFEEYWSSIESACRGTHRSQRDADWGVGVQESGLFGASERKAVSWVRRVTVDRWLTDQASHSYVIALPAEQRGRLMARLASVVQSEFPEGEMSVTYETWLWTARLVDDRTTAREGLLRP